MSELTNIHARAVKDLTTPTNLPADPNALDQVKLVAGNFPAEYAGNEAMTVGVIKELAAQGREAELEEVFQKITQEETRAVEAENLLNQNKAEKTYVDSELEAQNIKVNNHLSEQTQVVNTALSQLSTAANKFYSTKAEGEADIANIAVNQPVTIGEAVNGGLWYKATAEATTLTKSPFDPVGLSKQHTDNSGVAQIVGQSLSSINYDTATRTLNFTGTIWINTTSQRYALTVPQSLTLTSNAPYRIEYNIETGLLSATNFSNARSVNSIVCGFVTASDTTLSSTDFSYTVDNVRYFEPQIGYILNSVASRISFDNTAKTLTINSAVRVKSERFNSTLDANQVINYPSEIGTYRLDFNIKTKTFSFVRSDLNQANHTVSCSTVYINSLINTSIEVYGVDNYTVDGRSSFAPEKGELINQIASRIAFDDTAKTLTINGAVRVNSANLSKNVNVERVVPYPTAAGTYFIDYDVASNNFEFRRSDFPLLKLKIQCGLVVIDSNLNITDVSNIQNYTLNGKIQYPAHAGTLINTTASRIAFNTETMMLTLHSEVRVKSPLFTKQLGSQKLVSLQNAAAGVYSLNYNILTDDFSVELTSVDQKKNTIRVATIYNSSGKPARVIGIDSYSIDGVANTSAHSWNGLLSATDATAINFDTIAKTVSIQADKVRLNYADKSILLSAYTLDISENSTVWNRIVYNSLSKTMRIVRTTLALGDNDVHVALFKLDSKQVFDIPNFTIDGQQVSGVKDDARTVNVLVPFGDVEPNYVQPTLQSYADYMSSHLNDFSKIYELYDDLMSANSNYITKYKAGEDALGNAINVYQFNAPEVYDSTQAAKRAKIIIFSSIHGYEKAGVYNTYLMMKEICERWQADSKLKALRWGVHFVIVPIAVPSGYAANARKNHNGVDIARNFASRWWAYPDPSAAEYGGTAPYDQAESVVLNSVLNDHKDAIAFFSHHNFHSSTTHEGWMPQGNFMWVVAKSVFTANMAKNLIVHETLSAKEKYPAQLVSLTDYIGYTNIQMTAGNEATHAQDAYGIQSVVFEVCDEWHWLDGRPNYSSEVATVGVESIVNWVLLNLKHTTQLNNLKFNI